MEDLTLLPFNELVKRLKHLEAEYRRNQEQYILIALRQCFALCIARLPELDMQNQENQQDVKEFDEFEHHLLDILEIE